MIHPRGTLPEILERNLRERPEKAALIVDGERVSYRELYWQSTQLARELRARGLSQRDRVAVIAPDCVAVVVLYFATVMAGGVVVPVNVRMSEHEIARILDDAAPTLVFLAPQLRAMVAGVMAKMHDPIDASRVLALRVAETNGRPLAREDALEVECDPAEAAVQLYTSGTTGSAKGVVLPHQAFFALAHEMEARGERWIGWTCDDVSLLFVPTFHIGGLWWLVRGLDLGSTCLLLPGFEPSRILAAVGEHRVTRTCMVPSMMRVLLSEPGCETADFSSLRTIVYGGAPADPLLLAEARRVFQCDLCQIYGMTETGNMAVCLRPEDHDWSDSRRLLVAGRPLPGVEVRILLPDGAVAAVGEVGEIEIRSPARMIGYWNRPEETASTMSDGWIRTGDAGSCDGVGFVSVCDRTKDMIICGGENVYPTEIENVIRALDAVEDAAVIGIPDDLWGETVAAFVVLRRGATLDPREIVRYSRQRLAAVKVPGLVEIVTGLPRTASGKVQKAKLREPYWRGRARPIN